MADVCLAWVLGLSALSLRDNWLPACARRPVGAAILEAAASRCRGGGHRGTVGASGQPKGSHPVVWLLLRSGCRGVLQPPRLRSHWVMVRPGVLPPPAT